MVLAFGDHQLDIERRELRRGAMLVDVEPKVFDLLVFLVQNRDRVVSRDDLLEAVWAGRLVSESALTTRVSAARKAISDRFSGHYLPEKPRIYQGKAKNAQEAHEAIRPTDFTRDRAGQGDEARLYDLIFKRAMASQMAAASLERSTVTLRDPTGRHELRATGQVVKFPGFLAVYEEGRDAKSEDDDDNLLPVMRKGDSPAKTGVEATQPDGTMVKATRKSS